MVRQTRNVIGWKQKAKLFGILRSVHIKKNPKSAIDSSTYATKGVTESYKIVAEQEKAKATEFVLKKALSVQ